MISNNKVHSVTTLKRKEADFNFDDPIQRGEDQWDVVQKTKLIDSLLRDIPVDPARVIESEYTDNDRTELKEGLNTVIDGKQRLTTIIAFLKDDFGLDINTLREIQDEGAGAYVVRGEAYTTDRILDETYENMIKAEKERVEKEQEKENKRVEKENNKHKKDKNYKPLKPKTIKENKIEKDKIKDIKFSALPDVLKTALESKDITVCYLTKVTPWEKTELFKRQNNGKNLTKAQMNNADYTPESYKAIKTITSVEGAHYEWTEVSKNRAGEVKKDKNGNDVVRTKTKDLPNIWHRQLSSTIFKSGEDRQIVLQTLMLIDNFNDGNFGFENDTDIQGFIAKFNGMNEAARAELVEKACTAAKEFNTALGRESKNIVNLKKTSVSMLVAGMNLVLVEGKDPKQYIENVRAFFARYKNTDEDIEAYKNTITKASASKDHVAYRWNVFKGFVENTPAKTEA